MSPLRGRKQAAEHLDGGRLARAVRAQQPVDLAVPHLHGDVLHRRERSELFGEIRSADGNLAAQAAVIAASGKRLVMNSLSQVAQGGDECVFERRFVDPNIVDHQPFGAQCLVGDALRLLRLVNQQVQPVAESLHVDNLFVRARDRGKHALSQAQIRCVNFHAPGMQAGAQLGRRSDLPDLALMHERHAVAALGFVEIGGGENNGQAIGGKVRERIPEFAARHGIDARGGLVEQQHARLRNQRAGQRQLLLHAAAQPAGQPMFEAVHVEHAQIAASAPGDLIRRHAAQIADVADVFGDGEIRIEAERLRQIAGVRARFAGRHAENFRRAGGGFHHSGEDLERGGLACAVRADQSEDFAVADFEIDAPNGFQRTVAFPEIADPDCRAPGCGSAHRCPVPAMEFAAVIC